MTKELKDAQHQAQTLENDITAARKELEDARMAETAAWAAHRRGEAPRDSVLTSAQHTAALEAYLAKLEADHADTLEHVAKLQHIDAQHQAERDLDKLRSAHAKAYEAYLAKLRGCRAQLATLALELKNERDMLEDMSLKLGHLGAAVLGGKVAHHIPATPSTADAFTAAYPAIGSDVKTLEAVLAYATAGAELSDSERAELGEQQQAADKRQAERDAAAVAAMRGSAYDKLEYFKRYHPELSEDDMRARCGFVAVRL